MARHARKMRLTGDIGRTGRPVNKAVNKAVDKSGARVVTRTEYIAARTKRAQIKRYAICLILFFDIID